MSSTIDWFDCPECGKQASREQDNRTCEIYYSCSFCDWQGEPVSQECEARKKLEAAAPDLLAACEAQEEADNWFGSSSTGRKLKNEAYVLRQAAITKATQ